MRKNGKALTLSPPSTYCAKRRRAKEDGREPPERKRKVLHLVSQWMALCRDFLREDEHVKVFMKVRGAGCHTRAALPNSRFLLRSGSLRVCWRSPSQLSGRGRGGGVTPWTSRSLMQSCLP